ncbi:toxin biosynthesis protein [Xylaria arbuscula]|nr:toxin biosynthesis protein [Xylaria arbuscula]
MVTTSITPRKLQEIPASAGCDAVLKAVREDGAVIIKGLFTYEQVARLNSDVQPVMDTMSSGSKHDKEWVRDFHGDSTKRLNNIVGISATFRAEFLEHPLIHAVCEAIYLADAGDYWMNSTQVIDIAPGSKPQPLHRDQWQFPVFQLVGPSAPEASCNFIVALSRFTEANGATRVIPGSHLWADFSDNGDSEDTTPAEMDIGDACFISGKVVHGGGGNKTVGETRRGMAIVFQCSYLTPEEAHPFNVDVDIARTLSARGQRMIGFRSQFLKDSPGVWKRNYAEVDEAYAL